MSVDGEFYVKLDDTLADAFSDLETMTPGSEEAKAQVDNIVKLAQCRRDMIDADAAEEDRDRKREHDKKWDWINFGLKVAEIGVPVLVTIVTIGYYNNQTNKLLKFEETGTLTSSVSRNFFGKMKPNKL